MLTIGDIEAFENLPELKIVDIYNTSCIGNTLLCHIMAAKKF